jgi:hypothetical protein
MVGITSSTIPNLMKIASELNGGLIIADAPGADFQDADQKMESVLNKVPQRL